MTCDCGCGTPTTIYRGTARRFVHGHSSRVRSPETRAAVLAGLVVAREKSKTPEALAKLSVAKRGKKCPARTGERHPGWRGDAVGYHAAHGWLRRHFSLTGVCDRCAAETKTEWSFRRRPDDGLRPYTRNRDDYRELCLSCHRTVDHWRNR